MTTPATDPSTRPQPLPDGYVETSLPDRYVETYHDVGVWKSRRHDCTQPFATGASRQRLIAIGAEVARWNQVPHVIRDTGGAVIEVNSYSSYPVVPKRPA
ncbi:MAG TPA: DUF2188 domain-containing protein [Kribbellaceae bacterium]